MKEIMRVRKMVAGNSHPGCYTKALNDCLPKLTREYYISKSILELWVPKAFLIPSDRTVEGGT